jgi:hypothetical protein
MQRQIMCRHTNASQTRFGVATRKPDGYFVFVLTRLGDNATNVILEFKVFTNYGPEAKFKGRWKQITNKIITGKRTQQQNKWMSLGSRNTRVRTKHK